MYILRACMHISLRCESMYLYLQCNVQSCVLTCFCIPNITKPNSDHLNSTCTEVPQHFVKNWLTTLQTPASRKVQRILVSPNGLENSLWININVEPKLFINYIHPCTMLLRDSCWTKSRIFALSICRPLALGLWSCLLYMFDEIL